MCGIVDDILPVLGGVGGFLLGGPAGAAIGGSLGGFAGNYAQNHNLLGGLEGAITGGVGGYFGGGSLANALSNLGSAGVGATSAGFDTSLAAASPVTSGGLESSLGGSALLGVNAGTGTALGSAGDALGGSGLGIAGGDALSGISSAPSYLGGLGGGYQGTGLGLGAQGSSTADLAGITSGTGGTTAGLTSPTASTPVSSLSSVQGGQGITNPMTPSTSATGSNIVGEGSQAAGQTGSGAPMAFDNSGVSLEGTQTAPAMAGASGPDNLAALYGGQSTAAGSATGQGITDSTNGLTSGVQYGGLGEGTSSAPGIAGNTNSLIQSGATKVGDNDLSSLYSQMSPWMKLANTGLTAYQQYARQNAMNNYANQINQLYSPNSAYAQQMQQTLARQDAANGRNSQYGTRATQLAAALTEAQSRALSSNPYFSAATATPGASMLNGLFANFGSPQGMQQLGQIGSSAFNGLSSLFGGF